MLLPVLFAGCLKDQEQAVAQCRSPRHSGLASSESISEDNSRMELCMTTAGYEPDRTRDDCQTMAENVAGLTARCYQPTSFFGWLARKAELAWSG
jgi:hypothetical protein